MKKLTEEEINNEIARIKSITEREFRICRDGFGIYNVQVRYKPGCLFHDNYTQYRVWEDSFSTRFLWLAKIALTVHRAIESGGFRQEAIRSLKAQQPCEPLDL